MKATLSGIQPSGSLHLGNYFGMMKRMIEFQNERELYCFIVNYHALTSQRDSSLLKSNTFQAAVDFLSLGLDPDKCTLWIQSDVPEVTELTWILTNITSLGLMERCHSYKDKVTNGIKPSLGLFSYPVLMAADILIMQAEQVPVGKDQKQHIEVTQDIAERFNHVYGETFVVPQPEITEDTMQLPGLDGRKMSKSYDNTISIFDEQKPMRKRVMSIKTDSTPIEEPKPIVDNPLFDIYRAFLNDGETEDLKKRFLSPGLRYGDVKKELADKIWSYFEPYRQKRDSLLSKPDTVLDILNDGAKKASSKAGETMEKVREAVGLSYKKVKNVISG